MQVAMSGSLPQTGLKSGAAAEHNYDGLIDEASAKYAMSPLLKSRLELLFSRLVRQSSAEIDAGSVSPATLVERAIEKLSNGRFAR